MHSYIAGRVSDMTVINTSKQPRYKIHYEGHQQLNAELAEGCHRIRRFFTANRIFALQVCATSLV
jgi:hypothetical protein